MILWLALTSALCVSTASAQFGVIGSAVGNIAKEVVSIKDPIDKAVVYIGFSQCQNVKRILGVDYEQYDTEPDFSKLAVHFVTDQYKVQFNLSALPSLPFGKHFKPNQSFTVYLHGFIDDPTLPTGFKILTMPSLKKVSVGNIMALDASSLIRFLYLRSSTMVRFIGEQLGQALAKLIKDGTDPGRIHLVGHSLGSHIAGFAGKTVLAQTGSRIGRISGLDPAGPCFADVEANLRLNANDATYVDVIHTDAGVYGINEKVGHADYYPNRGSEQPNCLSQTCSHNRAWQFFAESVTNPNGFPAVSCADWKAFQDGNCDYNNYSLMGWASKRGTMGQFYLQTADSSPFALGPAGISYTNNDGLVRNFRDKIGLWK